MVALRGTVEKRFYLQVWLQCSVSFSSPIGEGGRAAAELDAPRGRASHPSQHGEALPHAQECQRGNQARLPDFLE